MDDASDERFAAERERLLSILTEERPEFPGRRWHARHRQASVRLAMVESEDPEVRAMVTWPG